MGSAAADELELDPIEHLDDLRAEWTALALATGHPFATWEWNACWWRWFGSGRALYCFSCRDQTGALVAILPLYVARTRPLRVARFLGYADLHSPVCAPADRVLAAHAVRQAMRRPGGCSLILAERLPCEQGWGELSGGTLLTRHENPVLSLAGISWEEYLASKSRNFREQVRRKERRLVEERGLTFRLTDPSHLDDDLDALFRLHAARWGDQSTGCFAGDRGRFHRDFAGLALRRGWLRLWLAEINAEPVAAWYGWRFAGVEWYFQAGRDPRLDSYSLGFVTLAHTVREACRDGVSAYNFLAGGDVYKWRFTAEDPGSETRLLSAGLSATAASVGVRLALSLPEPVRRRVLQGGST